MIEEDKPAHEGAGGLYKKNQKNGIRHKGLKKRKYTNPRLDRLVNYLTYRLELKTRKNTVRETGKIRDNVNMLELIFKDHKFGGSDHITVFEFCHNSYVSVTLSW